MKGALEAVETCCNYDALFFRGAARGCRTCCYYDALALLLDLFGSGASEDYLDLYQHPGGGQSCYLEGGT